MLYEKSVCLFDNNSGKLFKKRTQLDVDLTHIIARISIVTNKFVSPFA